MKKIKLFDDLQRYLKDIEEILPEEDGFLQSKVHQYSVSMVMLSLINACIDIGNEIITMKQLRYPSTYRDVFDILEKAKVIAPPLAKKMRNLVGLRNLLAHEYGEVDLELLYDNAKDVGFVRDFAESAMKQF